MALGFDLAALEVRQRDAPLLGRKSLQTTRGDRKKGNRMSSKWRGLGLVTTRAKTLSGLGRVGRRVCTRI